MSTEEIDITIKSLFLDIEEEFAKFKDWEVCEFKI
jgi:hypothetical protein